MQADQWQRLLDLPDTQQISRKPGRNGQHHDRPADRAQCQTVEPVARIGQTMYRKRAAESRWLSDFRIEEFAGQMGEPATATVRGFVPGEIAVRSECGATAIGVTPRPAEPRQHDQQHCPDQPALPGTAHGINSNCSATRRRDAHRNRSRLWQGRVGRSWPRRCRQCRGAPTVCRRRIWQGTRRR